MKVIMLKNKKREIRNCLVAILSSAFLAFGLYHVHSLSGVTEGGVLGMTLLLDHWFGISPAFSGFVMNVLCYCLGWKLMGKEFLGYSSVLGAVFVGVGAGLCVRIGGAPGGDDALAMSISYVTKWKIQWVYLLTDAIVLGLSLSYIPVKKIGYSILTVLLSGQIIGLVQKVHMPQTDAGSAVNELE